MGPFTEPHGVPVHIFQWNVSELNLFMSSQILLWKIKEWYFNPKNESGFWMCCFWKGLGFLWPIFARKIKTLRWCMPICCSSRRWLRVIPGDRDLVAIIGFNSAAVGLCKEVSPAPKMFGDMLCISVCLYIPLSQYLITSLYIMYIKLFNTICIYDYLQLYMYILLNQTLYDDIHTPLFTIYLYIYTLVYVICMNIIFFCNIYI